MSLVGVLTELFSDGSVVLTSSDAGIILLFISFKMPSILMPSSNPEWRSFIVFALLSPFLPRWNTLWSMGLTRKYGVHWKLKGS